MATLDVFLGKSLYLKRSCILRGVTRAFGSCCQYTTPYKRLFHAAPENEVDAILVSTTDEAEQLLGQTKWARVVILFSTLQELAEARSSMAILSHQRVVSALCTSGKKVKMSLPNVLCAHFADRIKSAH